MSNPIRLAFCITDLDVGGAERALVEIVTRLDRSRWEPAVFCLASRGELADVLEAASIPVTCFGADSVVRLDVAWRLRNALRRWKPQLLQSFLFHANVLGRIAGSWAGVPTIVSGVRVADRRGAWRHWVDRWTASRAVHHVCVSECVARFTVDRVGIPRDRISVIPNGVDFERHATADPADLSEFGIVASDRVVLFVGRFDPQKDPLGMIDAFEIVADEISNAHLLLVGDGPLRNEIERRCAKSRSSGRLHVVGRRGDVPRLMKASSLLTLSSIYEGMPNVVLEAMASGLPVVATAVEGMEEILAGGELGTIVPVESPSALATAIIAELRDPTSAIDLATKSQEHCRTRFTWRSVIRSYDDLYSRLLAVDA